MVYLGCKHGNVKLMRKFWSDRQGSRKGREVIDANAAMMDLETGEQRLLLAIAIRVFADVKDTAKKKMFRDVIRFLFDKGAVISWDVARECPNEIFRYLQSSNRNAYGNVGNHTSILRWANKHLGCLYYERWILPYSETIVELNLSENPLTEIQAEIPWGLPCLERLTITSCPLLEIMHEPRSPIQCHKLHTVTVSKCRKLSFIPEQVFSIQQLRRLDLSQNALRFDTNSPSPNSPKKARSATLREHSHQKFFPSTPTATPRPSIQEPGSSAEWSCKHLDYLNLGDNKFEHLPNGIRGATRLRTLNLEKNFLKTFPQPWSCQLIKLNLSDNQLESLPEDMDVKWKMTLQTLDVSRNRLKELPHGVCGLRKLVYLDLSHNQLHDLPPPTAWICRRLEKLNLKHNNLGDKQRAGQPQSRFFTGVQRKPTPKPVPPVVALFPSNGSPHVSHASGRTQPIAVNRNGGSQNHLPLSATPPPGFNILSTSSQAHAANTFAVTNDVILPNIFSERIRSINLTKNGLLFLPESICGLNGLTELHIGKNPDIHTLPYELGKLKNLEFLKMEELDLNRLPNECNPKKNPNVRTIQILEHLRTKLRKEEPWQRMKLIFVGKEESGKTTLIHQLIGNSGSQQDGRHKEQVLVTYNWRLETPSNLKKRSAPQKTFNLVVWELTGPENLNPVHQCFISDHALFVLTVRLDGRGTSTQIASWLVNIKARAPHSKVLIVGTRLDTLQRRTSWEAEVMNWREMLFDMANKMAGCPRIIDFIAVSADIGQNIYLVKQVIYEHCLDKLKNKKVPRSYTKLYDEIMTEKQHRFVNGYLPWLSKRDIWHMVQDVAENDIQDGDEEELLKIARLFHEFGSFVHFSDSIRTLETSYYYLDPVWLSQRIVNMMKSRGSKRKLQYHEIENLLVDPAYDCEQDVAHLVEILHKFELLFLIKSNWVLIPCRLPQDAPEIEFDLRGPIISRIYRMNCIPSGFWSRLLVRLLQRLRDSVPTKRLHRKVSGVVPPLVVKGASLIRSSLSTTARRSFSYRDKRLRKSEGREMPWQAFYWAKGCVVQFDEGCLRIESFAQSPIADTISGDNTLMDNGVVITAQSKLEDATNMDSAYFTLAVDVLDLLISEWFPDYDYNEDRIERFAPCSGCLIRTQLRSSRAFHRDSGETRRLRTESVVNIGVFPLEYMAACAVRDTHYQCPVHEGSLVALPAIIPDLLMVDLPNVVRIDPAELVKEEYLTQGGQGIIYRGKYGNKDVAIKEFYSGDKHVSLHDQLEASISSTDTLLDGGGYQSGASSQNPTRDLTTKSKKQELSKTFRVNRISQSQLEFSGPDLCILYALQNMRREVMFLSSLNHPCIIGLVGAIVSPCQPICFVLEYAPLGNLLKYIQQYGEQVDRIYNEDDGPYHGLLIDRLLLYKFAHQTVVALNHLHKEGILFKDLKSENILVWSTNPDDLINIKLSDYGISSYVDSQGARGNEGTPGYQAPEIIRNMIYDERADIFSYAMVLYELFTAKPPFHEMQFVDEIQRAIKCGRRPTLQEVHVMPDFSQLEKLMTECWQDSPLARPQTKNIRRRMETMEFYLTRGIFNIRSKDFAATKLDFSVIDRTSKSNSWSSSEVAEFAAINVGLARYIRRMPTEELNGTHAWFATQQKDGARMYGVLDVAECHFEGEQVMLPGNDCADIAYASEAMYVLCGEKEAQVDAYRFNMETLMPEVVSSHDFSTQIDDLDTGYTLDTIECYESEKETILFLGTSNGRVLIFTSSNFDNQFVQRANISVLSDYRSPISNIKLMPGATECFVTTHSFFVTFMISTLEVSCVQNAFQSQASLDNLTFSADYIWCTSHLSPIIPGFTIACPHAPALSLDCSVTMTGSNILLDDSSFQSYIQGVFGGTDGDSATSSPGASLERATKPITASFCDGSPNNDSSSVDMDTFKTKSQSDSGIIKSIAYKDTLWVAMSLNCIAIVAIGGAHVGEVLSVISVPEQSNAGEIDDIELIGDSVLVLVTLETENTKPSIGRREESLLSPTNLSPAGNQFRVGRRCSTFSLVETVIPADEHQEIIILKAVKAEQLIKMCDYWMHLRQLENATP